MKIATNENSRIFVICVSVMKYYGGIPNPTDTEVRCANLMNI